MTDSDPFRHHPGLRGRIRPADQSFFRDMTPARLLAVMEEQGHPPAPFDSEETIEASRRAYLADHEGDLWVFAYGSLMWDPGIHFAEVRRAYAPHHTRRFILKDTLGGRGTAEAPGVMAALDEGAGCHGLAFRIAAEHIEPETRQLWFREKPMPGYHARTIPLRTDPGDIRALAFLADHQADLIDADLTFDQQARMVATGRGFLGTSLEYVENLCTHFTEMRIDDPDLFALARAARAHTP